MVAAAVLSLGMLFVFQSFFTVMRSFDYCSSYVASSGFAQERLWQACDSFSRDGSIGSETNGEFSQGGRTFNWQLSQDLVAGNLTKINLVLDWKSGTRKMEISRCAYAEYEKLQ
jgi:hypothetical protein